MSKMEVCHLPHLTTALIVAISVPLFPCRGFYYGDLWELSGDVNGTSQYDCDRIWFSYAHLHGLMMAVAWGILLPLGFLIARYYRFLGKAWIIIHVSLQVSLFVPVCVCVYESVCVSMCVCV